MDTPRWQLNLENFEAAVVLLDEAVGMYRELGLSELEKAGLIQRFENAWELGWRTMGRWLIDVEFSNTLFAGGSVIRVAATAGMVADEEGWLLAGKLRNILSHEYSVDHRDEAIELIDTRFLPMMQDLVELMKSKRDAA